jgi:hypothetical protein
LLPDHEVFIVRYLGWKGLKSGALLRTAESGGFEVFLTADQNLTDQQNTSKRKFGLVVLTAQKMHEVIPHLHEINEAIAGSKPGTVQVVKCHV